MILLILALCLFSRNDCCDDNVWRGLRPLKANRQDVEKVLGRQEPENETRRGGRFKLKDGSALVIYSRGDCKSEDNNGWNVAESTVILISYYPEPKIALADLNLNMRRFTKQPDGEITFLDKYLDADDGISITVDNESGLVEQFQYFPKASDKALRCK